MAIEVLVHLASNGNDLDTEEKLQSVLETPIKDTKVRFARKKSKNILSIPKISIVDTLNWISLLATSWC